METEMKLQEIADRITAHLKRFEADKKINKLSSGPMKISRYYFARAWSGGSKVVIRYIDYQSQTYLSKADAIAYLAWLDAGNVGKDYDWIRECQLPSKS